MKITFRDNAKDAVCCYYVDGEFGGKIYTDHIGSEYYTDDGTIFGDTLEEVKENIKNFYNEG